jgi:hypothetical protein
VGRPFTRPDMPPRSNTESTVKPGSVDASGGPAKGSLGTKTERPRPGTTEKPTLVAGLDKDRRRAFWNGQQGSDVISKVQTGSTSGDSIQGVKLTSIEKSSSKKGSKEYAKQYSQKTVINDNSVNYITNITYKNSSWGGHHHGHKPWHSSWCAPVYGPKACWNGWSHDGFSFGLGFGSGNFSFSLFYSNWGTPLHSSWCDPWWDGWCGSVVVHCPPRYRWCKPCWSPCGAWYTNYVVYRSVPASWCTPVYAWTPTVAVPAVTTINNNYYYDSTPAVSSTVYVDQPPVTTLPSALPPTTNAELDAWDLLGNGFPRSSAETFAELHDANPGNTRALVGYGLALAMLEDLNGAATVMRQAVDDDANIFAVLPLSQQLVERVRLLEQSSEVASRQASMARDGLFLLSASRAMQARYTEAHLAVLNAQAAGDDSLAAVRLRTWLESRMTPRI